MDADVATTTRSRTRKLLSVVAPLHTIYILRELIVNVPHNLFTSLHLPLNEPSGSIRKLLLRQASASRLPNHVETLLSHLQSFDARVAYVRFGHAAVQDCEFCTSLNDFALYALPLPILEYVREAAVIGLMTIRDSGRERWRFGALSVLIGLAIAEICFVLGTKVSFSPWIEKTLMIHDIAVCARRICFLLLVPLLWLIPPCQTPPSPLQALPELVAKAERVRARLHLLRLTFAARARHPQLRAFADAWWAEQRTDGQHAVNDPALQEVATKLNMAAADSRGSRDSEGLRERARRAVQALQHGLHAKN